MQDTRKQLQYRKDILSDRLRDLRREEGEIISLLENINKELSNMKKES